MCFGNKKRGDHMVKQGIMSMAGVNWSEKQQIDWKVCEIITLRSGDGWYKTDCSLRRKNIIIITN